MSKSSALSISVLLIFEMQLINGALFLKVNFLSYASLFHLKTVIIPFTTIYVSRSSHRSDLSIEFLKLICLSGLYLFSAVPD